MKRFIHLVVMLFFSSFWVHAQKITINENPVAYKYLLKHFGLIGKVKSVTTYGSGNNLMTTELYDEAGRLTKTIWHSNFPTVSEYLYDPTKKLITVKQQTGNLSQLNYLYQFNDNLDITFYLYKEGDPLRQFVYNGIKLVKDSVANKYSKEKAYYYYYIYNSKGQIIKLSYYNRKDILEREENYNYIGNTVTIKLKSISNGSTAEREKNKYYDDKGSLLKETFTSNGKTETTEYKPDVNGNWIWKTGGMTRKIEYYGISQATKPETSKTANND
jgi:hypothetical protein